MPSSILVPEVSEGGFNFTNCIRNAALEEKGAEIPKPVKTGTTIAGCVFKDGVILAADSRATGGNVVAEKECMKLYQLAPNMYAAGAGTAADMEHTCTSIRAQLELHRLNTGRVVPVVCAVRIIKQLLFKYQGHVSCYLIIGGVDQSGPMLQEVAAHGSSMKLPFTTTGSGCLAAMSVLESQWRPGMEEEEAKVMMKDAINAGILNDLGSGSTVNLVVIKKDASEFHLNYFKSQVKGERLGTYRYKKGTTAVLSTKVIPLEVESSVVHQLGGEAMET